jgi:hypothetical protein
LCKIIQTLNDPKPDPLRFDGGGLQRSLEQVNILTAPKQNHGTDSTVDSLFKRKR